MAGRVTFGSRKADPLPDGRLKDVDDQTVYADLSEFIRKCRKVSLEADKKLGMIYCNGRQGQLYQSGKVEDLTNSLTHPNQKSWLNWCQEQIKPKKAPTRPPAVEARPVVEKATKSPNSKEEREAEDKFESALKALTELAQKVKTIDIRLA